MSFDRIITMVINQVIRRLVGRGVNAGLDGMMGRKSRRRRGPGGR